MFGNKNWEISWAQVTGSMHIKKQMPCQDAICYNHLEEGSFVCAIADGHGSRACLYSDEGARLATKVAVSLIEEMSFHNTDEALYKLLKQTKEINLPQQIERRWKEAVRDQHQLKMRTPQSGKSLYELYGTTLMLFFVTASFLYALQIGDGDLLVVDETGKVQYVLEAPVTYGVETHSLCEHKCWRYAKSVCVPLVHDFKMKLFLMSTDGYANSFVSTKDFLKVGSDYLNLIQQVPRETLEATLPTWLTEASRVGSGDDITLALIYQKE